MNAHKTSVISGRVLGGNRLLARCDRLPYVFSAAIRCEHTTARQRLECARFIAAFAPHCLTHSPASTPRHSAAESGAEVTALQTLRVFQESSCRAQRLGLSTLRSTATEDGRRPSAAFPNGISNCAHVNRNCYVVPSSNNGMCQHFAANNHE